jgi:hypothetical protein
MNNLPNEIIALIAINDFELFTTLLRVPIIGMRLCEPYSQMIANEKFIKKVSLGVNSYATLLNDRFHSFDNQPAIVYGTQIKVWYKYGLKHRVNLPAVIHCNGTKEWYWYDKRHRDNDLPAIEHASNDKFWYWHGKQHRENDKPAIEYIDGSKCWYKHDKYIKYGS